MVHDLSVVALDEVPLALADIHSSTRVGDVVEVRLPALARTRVDDLVEGAGLEPLDDAAPASGAGGPPLRLRRRLSLADTVGADMRMLVCGLNPSPAAAETGIGFFRAGNRFWPAAIAAGLVTRDRDPRHALSAHGVGMTDLVKRTTARADQLHAEEYRDGVARVERLCAWLQPAVVCMVGLAGWRVAVDRRAVAGRQDALLGGRPVYVMPSTSGLNAATSLTDLVGHLRAAAALG